MLEDVVKKKRAPGAAKKLRDASLTPAKVA